MRRTGLLACFLSALLAGPAWSQDPVEQVLDGPVAEAEAEATEVEADEAAMAEEDAADTEEPAADEAPPTEEAAEPMGEPEELDASLEENAVEIPAEDADETADEDESEDDEDDDTEAAPAGTDWGGLFERAPAFLAKTHHAAVHLPIALWLFGAFFVLIGLVVPSWRNQVPLACLIGGALTSVAAVASGWWYAEYEWGEAWAWGDGVGDWSEHLVKHRWTGFLLALSSIVLSILALISQAKKSKSLGAVWRVGLLLLAAAVAWEGHVGGELIQGEGFLEEAFQEWVNPEAE